MPTEQPKRRGRPPVPKSRKRVPLNVSVAPATKREIQRQVRESGLSVGAVIDRAFAVPAAKTQAQSTAQH